MRSSYKIELEITDCILSESGLISFLESGLARELTNEAYNPKPTCIVKVKKVNGRATTKKRRTSKTDRMYEE
jgi:hypothetical protein